jgi:putative transposase
MPRLGRVVVPNYPHSGVQRGHNKQAVFAEADDFRYYLATLAEFKKVFGIQVYAFCLMANPVHLMLQPGEEIAGLGRLMKRLAGRQTRYVNQQKAGVNPAPSKRMAIFWPAAAMWS